MQSKRDQVQAHLFVMGRLATGMLRGEPDAADTPAGRTSRGTVTGLVVAALIGLVVTLYGVVVPGGATAWKKPGTLIVVKESGARYLYLDGSLHPVLNEASARLLAGDQLVVDQVSVKSLADTPRGAPIGILGAPDGLPEPAALADEPWFSCAVTRPGPGAVRAPGLALVIGLTRQGDRLADSQAVLIAAPDATEYLLWRGRRLRLDGRNGARQALGQASVTAYPVTAAFLNSLSAGPDLGAPELDGRGNAGPMLANRPTKVGQLFTGPGGDPYVLTSAGLAPLSRMAFELLRNDQRTQSGAYGGAAVTPAALTPADLAAHTAPAPAANAALAGLAGQGLPASPPDLLAVPQGRGVCADLRLTEAAPTTSVALLDAAAVAGLPPAAQPGVEPGCGGADSIAVRPGGGALVRALSGAGVGSTLYLVTDGGVKYPLASAAVAKQLGYGAATPVAVPESLLTLLPSGPSLDPAPLTGATAAPRPSGPACPR
ncbi:type VII secretion protein EccB [Kitasatospora sp. NPDC056181]|uniref:type VII secretion protein EccB n=1 Tax=Kitasatospora sp. NPDC056181 TaxID=3345737 RepID=UPI0035D9BD7D